MAYMDDPFPTKESPSQPEAIPVQYFNGFSLGVGNADFSMKLRLENQDFVLLKCSYTVAKTLAEKLPAVVTRFEKMTGHTLMTTQESMKALKAEAEKKAAEKKAAAEKQDVPRTTG
jgi:thermostable 8-oxoguanine DNA glycosylase